MAKQAIIDLILDKKAFQCLIRRGMLEIDLVDKKIKLYAFISEKLKYAELNEFLKEAETGKNHGEPYQIIIKNKKTRKKRV